ncbi:MAG: GNAT family N-acetyltransferase [Chitinivibrionales bacterium]|nr:GNAT family N-acetyltransferase [Chitinivibrionales bacterium]
MQLHDGLLSDWARRCKRPNIYRASVLRQLPILTGSSSIFSRMAEQRTTTPALSIEISLATAADAEAIVAVQRLAFKSQAELYGDDRLPPLLETAAAFRESLATVRTYKADLGGTVVGSVRGARDGVVCDVSRLSVHPDYQRRGIGVRLMEALEADFGDCERFELFTGARSQASIELYRRLGYEPYRTSVENGHVPLVHLRKVR